MGIGTFEVSVPFPVRGHPSVSGAAAACPPPFREM